MKRLARIGGVLATIAVLALTASSVWHFRYDLSDWLILQNYEPPAAVEQLATESGMNAYGRRLYLVNRPQISNREAFATQCTTAEQTIVLGCYNGVSIYIFDVTDPRLYGVKQVTAAHEMLHAAYNRLSKQEQEHVNALTMTAFKRMNDPRINELAQSYGKTEPGQVQNELHSILGTEVRNLGPELEAYYAKYFSDRSKVVTLSENYLKVFTDLKNQVDRLDADLALRKSEINRREASLTNQASVIAAQKSKMDALLATNQTAEYNSLVPSYNAKVDSYNQGLATVRRLVDEYNTIVEQRNGLGIEQSSLAQSLDSRLETIGQ